MRGAALGLSLTLLIPLLALRAGRGTANEAVVRRPPARPSPPYVRQARAIKAAVPKCRG